MKFNIKNLFLDKSLIGLGIGFIVVVMIVIVTTIVVIMNEREELFLEGAVKSSPLIKDSMIAEMGTLYVELEDEFEAEINRIITREANKTNKRGDYIYYGVNGKENPDMLKNDDFVNGVNLNYIKSDTSKADGESNFNDMVAVIASIYGEDCDRYHDDVLDTFKWLFNISHSYNAESTDLYPCKHGCKAIFYYCGDSMIQGSYGGEDVGHFNSDLKYQPWFVKSHSKYYKLQEYLDELTVGKNYEIDMGFKVENLEGICEVDSKGKDHFSLSSAELRNNNDTKLDLSKTLLDNKEFNYKNTRDFVGCTHTQTCECFHNSGMMVPNSDSKNFGQTEPITTCSNYDNTGFVCPGHYHTVSDGEGGVDIVEDPCPKEGTLLGCCGYYFCEGHEHWCCHGHVVVCCFGHTTLNLDINILYYEAMLDELKKLR